MALNTSGPISIAGTTAGQSIQVELLGNGTTQMSLNDASVRTLAGVASGTITMPTNFYGKSSTFNFTISSNQSNANLRTLAVAAGWDQSSKVNATVSAGVYVWSNSTGTPALTINGAWPNGVTLNNNGYIIGQGGTGASGNGSGYSSAGNAGGPAISLGVNATIVNNSGAYIAGGGGGGAASYIGTGGGGAGGGNGGSNSGGGGGAGGAGGAIGSAGANGGGGWGGGGGRILPGVGGLSQLGGGAGGGGGDGDKDAVPGASAAGGSAGNPGQNTSFKYPFTDYLGGGGGGWGASGGSVGPYTTSGPTSQPGGAGGNAIVLNGYSATTSGTGTTYGAVS
jgi:hypothetical protein